jgi:hypothetical protein
MVLFLVLFIFILSLSLIPMFIEISGIFAGLLFYRGVLAKSKK